MLETLDILALSKTLSLLWSLEVMLMIKFSWRTQKMKTPSLKNGLEANQTKMVGSHCKIQDLDIILLPHLKMKLLFQVTFK